MTDAPSSLLEVGYLVVPALWVGLLTGVAFIATPAKFYAALITRPVALDVGRVTFGIWNNVEWLMLALFMPLIVFTRPGQFPIAAIGVLAVFVLIQTMVLLPALNDRVITVVAGGRPPDSTDHLIYIAIDVLKLFVLVAIIWKQCARMAPLFAQLR
jgi:hypothetical protein